MTMTAPDGPQPARPEETPAPERSASVPIVPSRAVLTPVGWGPALLAATLAGLLAWAGGEWIEKANPVRVVSEFQVPGKQQFAERSAAITNKAVLSYALLGAAVGLTLGLAGGIARRSAGGTIIGAVAGLLLGGIAGGGSAALAVPFFLRNEDTTVSDDLILPLLTHGAIWSALGAAAGLALGIGLRAPASQTLRLTLGGLLGAVVATTIYELVGGLAFPFDQTGQPISAGIGSRLFARLVLAIAVAAGAILPTRRARQRKVEVPALEV
jgi:hypothetical protein